MKKYQQGFTLIELMIVVAIIGILAAIAIPQYNDFTARSQMAEALSLGGGLKTAIVEVANQGAWGDADSNTNGIPAEAGVAGKYVEKVNVTDGLITATMRNASPVASAVRGKTLLISPVSLAGSVQWTCKSTTTAQKYLPKSCTGI